jgi:hypothetical protein
VLKDIDNLKSLIKRPNGVNNTPIVIKEKENGNVYEKELEGAFIYQKKNCLSEKEISKSRNTKNSVTVLGNGNCHITNKKKEIEIIMFDEFKPELHQNKLNENTNSNFSLGLTAQESFTKSESFTHCSSKSYSIVIISI